MTGLGSLFEPVRSAWLRSLYRSRPKVGGRPQRARFAFLLVALRDGVRDPAGPQRHPGARPAAPTGRASCNGVDPPDQLAPAERERA